MMSVDLVVNALVTGAAAGASSAATTAVTDAYSAVKQGVRRLFHRAAETEGLDGDPDLAVDELIARVEADPDARRSALTETLTSLSAILQLDDDADLMAAARRVLELAGTDDAWIGKYHVELRDNTGVQIGERNEMTLNIHVRHRDQS